MSTHENRSVYVKSPWQFEVHDNPVAEPGPGQLLVRIAACAACGTDFHVADRMAQDWQVFGHEVSGVVEAVGEGVTRFAAGDRVALDSSAPCGQCAICLPRPYGRGRPELCRTAATYYGSATMGFGKMLLTPQQCAVAVPQGMKLDVAALTEPLGVSKDLVETAQVGPGDHVLIIGPGPLGLGAAALARHYGAERVILAGRSRSEARMAAGEALGADLLICVDETPLAAYDFGRRRPDKILVTAPPQALAEAIAIAAFGGVVAYIGIAWGPGAKVTFDADAFHFNKMSLRASHASPGTHAAETIRLLADMPQLGAQLISHRFGLEETGPMLTALRDEKRTLKKAVMVNQ